MEFYIALHADWLARIWVKQYKIFLENWILDTAEIWVRISFSRAVRGVIWGGLGGAVAPQGKRKKKKKEEKKEKKEKKRKKEEKKKERKKGTINNVKLLHIKCCFSQLFNSLVASKN